MSVLTRDGTTVGPVSRDPILRRERGQGKHILSCSVGNKQDWQDCTIGFQYAEWT